MVIQEIICPACGSLQHYTLKDNRLQCANCRKKYTLSSHRSKLSQQILERIALSFCQMIPATTAATEMGVNSKTIQKYYDLLRRTVSEANEKQAINKFGSATIDPALFYNYTAGKGLGPGIKPLLCLAKKLDEISLLFVQAEPSGETATVADTDVIGWVYAREQKSFDSLDLDRIHFLLTVEDSTAGAAIPFWVFAKKGLVKYHGGFRKNFYLFMREMEFRFNNHNKGSTQAYLTNILQGDLNNTETGDDNVQV
ncbi:MAG: transposase [Geobacteraceae bacterium]|nr:transposase [Geobacteraceae bacterium]NTW79420.1 transposase [Geobacteraceae bacterium]